MLMCKAVCTDRYVSMLTSMCNCTWICGVCSHEWECVYSVNVNMEYFSICVHVCDVHAYVMRMFICMHTHMYVHDCEGCQVSCLSALYGNSPSLSLGLAILTSPAR